MMWRFPLIVLLAMNFTDFSATAVLLKIDGYQDETNPVLVYLMNTVHGIWPILAMKFFFVAILAYFLVHYQSRLIHRAKLITNTLWGLSAGLTITTIMGILMLYGIQI